MAADNCSNQTVFALIHGRIDSQSKDVLMGRYLWAQKFTKDKHLAFMFETSKLECRIGFREQANHPSRSAITNNNLHPSKLRIGNGNVEMIIVKLESIYIVMLFPEDQFEGNKEQHERIITILDNQAIEQKPVEVRLKKKKMTFKQLGKILNINTLRLFNSEGAEYFEDDLEYVKNKTVLYASRGEDFDPACCFGEYEMIKKLGQGGFGKVFLASKGQNSQLFAIKIIKTENIDSAADIDAIFGEVEILKSLRHENIVKVYNCLPLKNMEVAIIMEYLEGGELLELVQKEKKLSEGLSKLFFKQIVKGMVYCHQNNLIHRDLKLENLLLVNSEENKIKIIDFGIAGVMNYMTWEDMDTGSLGYMAPQCFINNKNYKVDGRIDVWAVGVILFCMLTGELPFRGANTHQIVEAIKAAVYKIPYQIEKLISDDCKDVIKQCLNPNSKTRITMQQLMQHPWLNAGLFKCEDTKEVIAKVPLKEQEVKVKQIKKNIKPKTTKR